MMWRNGCKHCVGVFAEKLGRRGLFWNQRVNVTASVDNGALSVEFDIHADPGRKAVSRLRKAGYFTKPT